MTTTVTSAAWWRAALIRALRTALVIAVPYIGGSALGALPWATIGSAVGFAFLASIVTSLAGLPEVAAGAPVWLAILERVAKTLGQALAAGFGTAVLLQDVDWSSTVQAALIAALGTLLLTVIGRLPETRFATPVAVTSVNVNVPR